MTLEFDFQADLSRFLPVTLMERLPEREALRAAIAHLNGVHTAVKSFLPQYIADEEELIEKDYSALRLGAFLFADVSGFTALSEKIQQQSGAEGSEILTTVFNDYFATMLEILAKSDGQLLKFAGDALLAFFPNVDNPDDLTETYKAIRTGLRMQRAMKAKFQPVQNEQLMQLLGSDHTSSLSMSIGIARGSLFEALVGNNTQRDHIIQGDLPGLAMQAEGVGDRDEVIVDDALAQAVAAQFRSHPLAEGFSQIIDDFGDNLDDYEFELLRRRKARSGALFDFETTNLLENLRSQLRRVQAVSRYVAPNVLHELVNNDDHHLLSQNRFTTTVFVHCTGFAEMLNDWGDDHLGLVTSLLGRFYNIVQRIITSYGGTLARTDPYKLGIKMLITFGAPVAHPDDPERAVTAALEIRHQLQEFNARLSEELPPALRREQYVSFRVGITQGEIFAGEVGWKQRREFTVMGDDVNLAARLMANAEMGHILISSRVYEHVQHAFEVEALEPLILKGKRKPIHPFSVVRAMSPAVDLNISSDLPFIGHDMFMLSLTMTLRQAMGRRRRALALVGDAGIGKTRIAKQFVKAAQSSGFRVAWASCQTRNNRKTTWSAIVAQLLDLEVGRRDAEARRLLSERLRSIGLPGVESVLSELLFDSVAPSVAVAPKAAAQTPPATPADAPVNDLPPETQKRVTDLFAAVQKMSTEEMRRSGLFGLMRRATENNPEASGLPVDKSGLWKQAEKRTSLEDGLVSFIRHFCDETPTLIVIDDVHQENSAALELLRYLLANVTQGKLVLLVTYEPTVQVGLDIQTLLVPDLTQDETNLIAMAILHASELGPRLAELLWTRTSGRPLFVESLLRTLHDRDFIEIVNGRAELRPEADIDALPEDVRQLVVSRLDRLSDSARSLLWSAAILEADFTVEALAALSETTDLDAIRLLVEELVSAQIIQEVERGIHDFRHGMTQRVIYETLSRMQRMKLHRLAVNFYRQQPRSIPQTMALAFHLTRCGLLPQAVEVVVQAAETAEAEQDIDGAIELYRHALALFPDEKSIHQHLERLQTLREAALQPGE